MRTAPVFIPEQKSKQTITDLKVQQRDNRVRLSWKINKTERINRLKKFDLKSEETDYFLIHQKLIQIDCIECEPKKLPDLKVVIPSDSMIQDGEKVFYYLQFPENGLKLLSYQISHYGPDGEIISQSQPELLRRSNVFPKIPVPKLKIVQIEDQSQILRFPFGKVVQHKKNKISDENEKIGKSEEINLQIQFKTKFRSFTLRISWPQIINQSLNVNIGKGDYFGGKELYRNYLYRSQNVESWPEIPINIQSATENYFLDVLKTQITPLTRPISVDTHPDILPPRIAFYIDLSVKNVDTWHYKLRLVDRFGNESEASEIISFYLPETMIFTMNFGKKILVPHTD